MSSEIQISSLLPISPATQERIRAVDDRIRLHVLSPEALARLNAPDPDPDTVVAEVTDADAAAVDQEIAEALTQSEVWFSFTWPGMQFPPAGGPLRWVQLASAGADRVLEAKPPEGVTITNVSGLHATPIGEWVLAFFLMHAKQMPLAHDNQRAAKWTRYAVTNLHGSTVAVIGLGAIGAEVARLSAAFGARVLATKRSAQPGDRAEHVDVLYPYAQLHEVLAMSDYVALCVPHTSETDGLIGAAEFRAMKTTGMLVNIARGPVIDWAAMQAALRSGEIAAVYTDVTVPEPLPADDPSWETPNLIITPHNSGNMPNYLDEAAKFFIDNLHRYVAGDPLTNIVDQTLGY
ncbi:MAG TPA: D-2-hydroxyacid dehydrogenase [Dehalococcoidia bacterium]|nr:D-2-hydroxyacid dehydrogenase [Dehalococcoidia bacterium]